MSCATGVNPSRKSERPQQQVGLDRSARCTGRPVLLASPRPPGRSVEPPPCGLVERRVREKHVRGTTSLRARPRSDHDHWGPGFRPRGPTTGAGAVRRVPARARHRRWHPGVRRGLPLRPREEPDGQSGGAPSARGSYAPFFGGRRYCAAYGYRYVMPGAHVDVHKPTERDACGGDRSASPAPVRTAAWNPTGWSPGSGAPATRGGARHDREPGRGGRSRTGPAIRSASAPQEAHVLPTGYVQGAVVRNGTRYLARRGRGAAAGGCANNASCAPSAKDRGGKFVLDGKIAVGHRGGRGPFEDLACCNSGGRLWTLAERPGCRASCSIGPLS